VRAGTLWSDVTEATTPFGLFHLSGSLPNVGVVGYWLGGGLSWLGRRHGLAANRITAIEVVTPHGVLVRATATEHPVLFWALRGGANFGVVTALEMDLFACDEVYAGMFLWPFERHFEVLNTRQDWTRTAPETVTTSFRIMHLAALDELPPFLAGHLGHRDRRRRRRRRGSPRTAPRTATRDRHVGAVDPDRAQPPPPGPGTAHARPQRRDAAR
jgi:FAD/FMN-containing dehydrogenase